MAVQRFDVVVTGLDGAVVSDASALMEQLARFAGISSEAAQRQLSLGALVVHRDFNQDDALGAADALRVLGAVAKLRSTAGGQSGPLPNLEPEPSSDPVDIGPTPGPPPEFGGLTPGSPARRIDLGTGSAIVDAPAPTADPSRPHGSPASGSDRPSVPRRPAALARGSGPPAPVPIDAAQKRKSGLDSPPLDPLAPGQRPPPPVSSAGEIAVAVPESQESGRSSAPDVIDAAHSDGAVQMTVRTQSGRLTPMGGDPLDLAPPPALPKFPVPRQEPDLEVDFDAVGHKPPSHRFHGRARPPEPSKPPATKPRTASGRGPAVALGDGSAPTNADGSSTEPRRGRKLLGDDSAAATIFGMAAGLTLSLGIAYIAVHGMTDDSALRSRFVLVWVGVGLPLGALLGRLKLPG